MIYSVNKIFQEIDTDHGGCMTYVKVKRILSGRPETSSQAEKKLVLAIIDREYKEIREKILKS